jgi:hypothetical protein
VSQVSARSSTGEFFAPTAFSPNRVMIDYIADASSGGDPHITTIRGEHYTLPNLQKSAEMYNNGELKIETQMKTMPLNYWRDYVTDMVRDSTYMSQTRITLGNSELVVSNHNLNVVSDKGKINYTLVDYNPINYRCYGKTIMSTDFRAKLLTVKTEKLGEVKIILVKLRDDTIINDMRFMANPRLLIVPASGALMSSKNVKWGDSFFY